ncbi:unnamed protein product [Kuraishia capsulata CBS 1993]|uniref:JmjC domain-containing protein n=1 Tax=Kuraishia capsulata CBS 1993 TaxID=1382522 RepID=W6MHV4_9ASCO|nr:uncharacterized protein KUCA_T00001362001 [Kuraishia capsulata CBS 1993]CDK25393.1 unnamed protein product [Kuraishia capsulata CBS 1993]
MASQVSKGFILSPTAAQFADPIAYLSCPEVIRAGQEYGILKVIPPKGWNPPLSVDPERFSFITRMQKLSELNMRNRSREFWLQGFSNYMKMRKKKVPNEKGMVRLLNGESIHLYDIFVDDDPRRFEEDLEDNRMVKLVLDYKAVLNNSGKKASSNSDSRKRSTACEVCHSKERQHRLLLCDGKDCDKMYHLDCLSPQLTSVPKGLWFCEDCILGGSHEYGFEEDMDSVFTLSEFQEHCKEFEDEYVKKKWQNERYGPSIHQLEGEFWRLVESQDDLEVRYGADIHQDDPSQISGFPIRKNPDIDVENSKYSPYLDHPFNLCNLPFSNGSVFNYIKDEEISGMTVPWIYVGSLFSTFCWHKEDHYTLSANYCHAGATKKWYGVPAKHSDAFEKAFRSIAPAYFQRQPDLLHQLVTLISPDEIIKTAREKFGEEIEITTLNQQANEFIVTFPKVYHAGFNCGYNFNEAVNFITSDWLKYGYDALQEYKTIGKENVFNHWKLLERILNDALHTPDDVLISKLEDKRFATLLEWTTKNFKEEYAKINKCIFEDEKMSRVVDGITDVKFADLLTTETVDDSPRRIRRRMTRMAMAGSKGHSDELLCHECKTALGFVWFEVDPSKAVKQEQLPTPKTTPVLNSESKSFEDINMDRETEFQRIIEEAKREDSLEAGEDRRKLRRVARSKDDNNSVPRPVGRPRKNKDIPRLLCVNDFKKLQALKVFLSSGDLDAAKFEQLNKSTTVYYDKFVLAMTRIQEKLGKLL